MVQAVYAIAEGREMTWGMASPFLLIPFNVRSLCQRVGCDPS